MSTRKQSTLKREPVGKAVQTRSRTDLTPRDIEDEDPVVEREDDATEFFEDTDEAPGDRRHDPLRRP